MKYEHHTGQSLSAIRGSQLTQLGRTALSLLEDTSFHIGEAYSLEPVELHSVRPHAHLVTRTLVQQEPDSLAVSTVIKPEGTEREQDVYVRLTPEQYIHELTEVLGA